jgi:hypothetical protein
VRDSCGGLGADRFAGSHTVAMDGLGVFVFADDGVSFFRSAEEAAGWVEAIDVDAGEYQAFIRLDGERLVPHVLDQAKVVLEASGHRDPDGLVELLERERGTGAFSSNPAQPESVANELLLGDWEARWPKWPAWLDRRLHGDGPERV